MPTKTSKSATLRAAQLQILVLEGELTYTRSLLFSRSSEISKLQNALRPFCFEKEPLGFKGQGNNLTPCLLRDVEVQRARAVLGLAPNTDGPAKATIGELNILV